MNVASSRTFTRAEHERTILRLSIGLEDPQDLLRDILDLFDALTS